MLITKEFEAKALAPMAKDDAMTAINKLAPQPVTAEQVYVGRARLANTQLDRSFEKFPVPVLERFAETLPGKPVLEGHDKTKSPSGRWFGASLARDENGVTHLVADYYTLAKSELAEKIGTGIAKDVSIGFKAAGRTCDLCGEKIETCPHQPGMEYDGKRCEVTYSGEPAKYEAMEGSFVWVGCQYGAVAMGMKTFLPGGGVVTAGPLDLQKQEFGTWTFPGVPGEEAMEKAELEARVKTLEAEKAALEAARPDTVFVDEGKLYRADLIAEIGRKLGVLEMPAELQLKLLSSADVATLKQFDADLAAKVNEKLGATPQSKMLGNGADVLPELREKGAAQGPPPQIGKGLRTSVFHNWDVEV